MICKERDCKNGVTWTGQVIINNLIMEVNLCDTHFQKFTDTWKNNNDE